MTVMVCTVNLIRIVAVADSSAFNDSDSVFTISPCFLGDNQDDMNGDCRVDIYDFAVLA